MLVERGSFRKALDFLVAARTSAVFGWELAAEADGGARVLCFAGAVLGAELLVAAAPTSAKLAALCEELGERPDEIGSAARAMCDARSGTAPDETRVLDELARLYNDFTNLQRELARKNAELERTVRERDGLLSAAAHDLRSPLGAISNFAAILSEDAGDRLDEDERHALARIEHSSRFMQTLVEGLLDVSRAHWGELVLALEEVEPDSLLRMVVAVNRPLAARKAIELEIEIEGQLPTLSLDANKIEQVLNNLIGNAIKFSHSGTRIVVTARAGANEVQVRVRDHGQGIPGDELAKLFRPFSRTSVRPTDGEPTTGLGLAIAKGIVDAHGGRIWAESKPSRGSTLCFTVPLATPGRKEESVSAVQTSRVAGLGEDKPG